MSFQCTVVTPEQQVLEETVTQCILPAHDGQIGIRTNRAPILIRLGVGPLRVDVAGGQRRSFFVDGGIAQMKDNKLTVLTDSATPVSEINAETAKAEYDEAAARTPTDEQGKRARQHDMQRALAKKAVAALK
jgi:F-type H+-transporting ATPase subunit epsilon